MYRMYIVLFFTIFMVGMSALSPYARPQTSADQRPIDPIKGEITTLLQKSFSLCQEFVDYDEAKGCLAPDLAFNDSDKTFRPGSLNWSNLMWSRFGVPPSDISAYQLAVTGDGKFGYRNGDKGVAPIATMLDTGGKCSSLESTSGLNWDNELLLIHNQDNTLTAVPVIGRSVVALTSFSAMLESCSVFTTHAGVALSYKYSKEGTDKFKADLQLAQGTSPGLTPISIWSAGTIEFDKAWSTPSNITNCSGHFKPSYLQLVNMLYYLNDRYGLLNLLTETEANNLWTDKLMMDAAVGQNYTASVLQSKFVSKAQIRPDNNNMNSTNIQDWCYSYPVHP